MAEYQNLNMMSNMLDPQVLASMLNEEINKAIRFAPLAEVDTTLEGRPGTTLTVPKWDYIGDAVDVAEGEPIPTSKLGFTDTQMTIKKVGKAVQITDEAILSGYGDPVGTAIRQIAQAIDHKVDNDVIEVLEKDSTQKVSIANTVDGLAEALDIFNDEDDEATVILMNPADASKLRLSANKEWLSGTELGANRLVSGAYGELLGVQIVRARKCPKGTAFLVKQGALRIMLKRHYMLETDRDILTLVNTIAANQLYGTYLYKTEKAVKITLTPTA